jgi:hypothetical protein
VSSTVWFIRRSGDSVLSTGAFRPCRALWRGDSVGVGGAHAGGGVWGSPTTRVRWAMAPVDGAPPPVRWSVISAVREGVGMAASARAARDRARGLSPTLALFTPAGAWNEVWNLLQRARFEDRLVLALATA